MPFLFGVACLGVAFLIPPIAPVAVLVFMYVYFASK